MSDNVIVPINGGNNDDVKQDDKYYYSDNPVTATTGHSTSSSIPSFRTTKNDAMDNIQDHDGSTNAGVAVKKIRRDDYINDDESSNNDTAEVDVNNNIQLDDMMKNDANNNPNKHARTKLSIYDCIMDQWLLFRINSGHFVNHKGVQFGIVMLIILNAMLMGVQTFVWVRDHPTVSYSLNVTDTIFLIIFTIEIVLQLIFYSWRFVYDGWLVFDFIVITTSWVFVHFRIVRAFRIFRSIRLITRVRTMKNLLTALFGVMPRLCAVGGLLCLVSYIFAVMLTEMFKDTYIDGITTDNFFGTLDKTFFTLFQIMTLDNWAEMTRDLCEVYWWAWMPITWFVVASGFVIANLIIAVICDAVAELKDDDKAKLHGQDPSQQQQQQQQQDEHNYSLTQPSCNNQGSLNLMSTLNGIYSSTNETSTIMMKRKMEMLELYMNTLTQMQNDTLQALLRQQQTTTTTITTNVPSPIAF